MGPLIGLFVVLHLLGMAAILGGWFTDRQNGRGGLKLLVWGARIQLLTGLILVGLHEALGDDLNYAKITTKLVVAIMAVGCAEFAATRQRRGASYAKLASAAAAATLINVLVAVFWHGAA